MVFTKQSKKLTTGLCQIYNLHDCKKRNAIKILQFLQSILECSLFTTSLLQFLQSLITCDKGLQKIQQKCGGQNNAINDRVNYNQNICSVTKAGLRRQDFFCHSIGSQYLSGPFHLPIQESINLIFTTFPIDISKLLYVLGS